MIAVTIIFVVQVCNLKRYYKSIKQKRIGEILKIDSMDIAEPEVFAIKLAGKLGYIIELN